MKKYKSLNLSDIQRAYYLGRTSGIELGGRSTKITYIIKLVVPIEKFERAFNQVIKEQDMLRAIILDQNNQIILDKVNYYSFDIIRYAEIDDREKENILESSLEEEFTKNFSSDQ